MCQGLSDRQVERLLIFGSKTEPIGHHKMSSTTTLYPLLPLRSGRLDCYTNNYENRTQQNPPFGLRRLLGDVFDFGP